MMKQGDLFQFGMRIGTSRGRTHSWQPSCHPSHQPDMPEPADCGQQRSCSKQSSTERKGSEGSSAASTRAPFTLNAQLKGGLQLATLVGKAEVALRGCGTRQSHGARTAWRAQDAGPRRWHRLSASRMLAKFSPPSITVCVCLNACFSVCTCSRHVPQSTHWANNFFPFFCLFSFS